jgi:hypothetical protein
MRKGRHSCFQLSRDIGELPVRNERDALSYAEFRQGSFGEYEIGFVSDAEIGTAIAYIHTRPGGSAYAVAFAHTGG